MTIFNLFHNHKLGELHFARLPRYGDRTYYGAWIEKEFVKKESLVELFRQVRRLLAESE